MSAPLLLISHRPFDAKYTRQTLYNVLEDTCYHSVPNHPDPFLNEKRVLGSTPDGWLILSEFGDGFICLWHPRTGSRLQMPPLDDTDFLRAVVLTKLPLEPDCHIIFTAPRSNLIAYCTIGDAAFKIQNDSVIVATRISRGRIYGVEALLHGFRLVVMEVCVGRLRVNPIFKLKGTIQQDKIHGVYLVDSEEELLLVYKMIPGFSQCGDIMFKVFQLIPERKECVKLNSIGNRTLFLSESGNSFCCPAAADNSRPECIYYTRTSSRTIYLYNIRDGSTTSLLPSMAINRNRTSLSWIPPLHSHGLLTKYFS